MTQQSEQQCRFTVFSNIPSSRKRPLQRRIIDLKMNHLLVNVKRYKRRYEAAVTSFAVLMMTMMMMMSLSCTAFQTSSIAMKMNQILRQTPRSLNGDNGSAIRRVDIPNVRKTEILRSAQQPAADDASEIVTVETATTNVTHVSANQSTLPLVDHSSQSEAMLQLPPLSQSSHQQQPLTVTTTTSPSTNRTLPVSFGDVVSRNDRPITYGSDQNTPSFGDVVSLKNKPITPTVTPVSGVTISEERQVANQIRFRNTVVAVLSIAVAIGNFVYQYLHPIEPIQILFALQQSSADVSVVGKNHKPTVIDFWAPWCENCKLSAATLQSIEKQYGNDVNFILINGDLASSWPYIEALGVDAIPHMSMISYDGVVETALIGPIPKHIIQEDIDVLLLNSRNNAEAIRTSSVDVATPIESIDIMKDSNQPPLSLSSSSSSSPPLPEHVELPHKMLDVFAGKPASARRVQF
jgi:thiol-disulfide isomerase/thioredoxin